jgi:hypothetical protein
MDSRQVDAVKAMLADCDEFVHAFCQDYPSETTKVEKFAADLATWADSNPVCE